MLPFASNFSLGFALLFRFQFITPIITYSPTPTIEHQHPPPHSHTKLTHHTHTPNSHTTLTHHTHTHLSYNTQTTLNSIQHPIITYSPAQTNTHHRTHTTTHTTTHTQHSHNTQTTLTQYLRNTQSTLSHSMLTQHSHTHPPPSPDSIVRCRWRIYKFPEFRNSV